MCILCVCFLSPTTTSPEKCGEDLCQEIEHNISAEGGKNGHVTSEDVKTIFSNQLGQRELDERRLMNLRTEKEAATFYGLLEKSQHTALKQTKEIKTAALFLKEFQVT
jgi:predicted ATPase